MLFSTTRRGKLVLIAPAQRRGVHLGDVFADEPVAQPGGIPLVIAHERYRQHLRAPYRVDIGPGRQQPAAAHRLPMRPQLTEADVCEGTGEAPFDHGSKSPNARWARPDARAAGILRSRTRPRCQPTTYNCAARTLAFDRNVKSALDMAK